MPTWKHAERQIAKILGGHRVGSTGRPEPDVITPTLAVEVKHRATLPGWLLASMQQATDNAGARMPILILHQKGQPYLESLVVMNLTNFIQLRVDKPPE